ncbi:MAG: hypothetical protein UX67_C0028G0024 [Candidatus Woesebacteria bacterium GW2011_GWF2_46_8]|uniref:Peptidase S9 prolyl oligopeptidase catalytic domain-containing protein n=1 Tax=Candidatus Woesebacteria bacterium GW2011_GWF2_46_8 TaxID=1618604 RepID=A0A0G1QS45_9BACT|nr:MAG: hypothetical protein UX67_C0028G0024 [Candidatus Woesebacteria bacterium GW2011_GWF2_46_8]
MLMFQKLFLLVLILAIVLAARSFVNKEGGANLSSVIEENLGGLIEEKDVHPLQIAEMRKKEYPGSEIVVEQELANGSNYKRYIASYKSEGLKIYGLLMVPQGAPPDGGFPAIIFNHGYISPEVDSTTEKYVAYQDGFARNDYVVFKPDYRGHGNSEGKPEGAYYSTAYTTDVLNAVASIQKLPDVNPEKIGMWGHSMGGHITLRSMVVTNDIKAGVIWAGVVASYEEMAENWRRDRPWRPSTRETESFRPTRQQLTDKYGDWETNPDFWDSISPIKFVADISGPVALHHGAADESVPWEFSESLKNALEKEGKEVEYYTYQGAGHNLSGNAFGSAMSRSIAFFDKYLK